MISGLSLQQNTKTVLEKFSCCKIFEELISFLPFKGLWEGEKLKTKFQNACANILLMEQELVLVFGVVTLDSQSFLLLMFINLYMNY